MTSKLLPLVLAKIASGTRSQRAVFEIVMAMPLSTRDSRILLERLTWAVQLHKIREECLVRLKHRQSPDPPSDVPFPIYRLPPPPDPAQDERTFELVC